MKKVYVLRQGTKHLVFTSLNKMAEYCVREFISRLNNHREPSYFLSKWSSPISYFESGFYKVFLCPVNPDINTNCKWKEIPISELEPVFDLTKKKIL